MDLDLPMIGDHLGA